MSESWLRITQPLSKGSEVVRRLYRAAPFDPVPWLIVIVAAVFVGHSLRVVNEWHLMTDEMLYQRLSFGVLDGHVFPGWVRDQPTDLRNTLFPILIAPLFGLLSVPSAVDGVIWLNSFLMAGAAVPAYLIARELTATRLHAWLVCAMVAATPWAAQSANVLTESTAYFVLVWALWAMYRCVLRPGWRGDLLACAVLGLAYLARTQLIVIAPVLPAAIVIGEVVAGIAGRTPATAAWRAGLVGVRRAVTGHVVLWSVVAAALLYLLAVGDPATLLGTYSGTSEGDLLPEGIWAATERNVGPIAMGVGAIPLAFAIAWAASSVLRGRERAHQAFATISVLCVPALALAATSFDLRYAGGFLAERYVFYVAPMFLIGFGAYFAHRRNVLWLVAGAAAAIHVLTRPAYEAPSYPYSSPFSFMTPVINGRADQITGIVGANPELSTFIAIAVAAAVTVVFAAFARFGARAFAVTGAVVLVGLAGQLHYLLPRVGAALDAQSLPFLGERTQSQRDWIDASTDSGDRVGIVDGPINWHAGQPFSNPNYRLYAWWDVEFWNKRVTSAYGVETTGFTLQPGGYSTPDFESGAFDLTLQQQPTHLVLSSSDPRLAPAGRVIEDEDPFALYELDQPVRLAWMSQGVAEDGWTAPGTPASIRVYGDPEGEGSRRFTLSVTVHTAPSLPAERMVTLQGSRERVRRVVETYESIPIAVCVSAGGYEDIRVRPKGSTDIGGRVVGVRLVGASVVPGEPC